MSTGESGSARTQIRAIGVLALVFGAAAWHWVGAGWRDRLMVAAGALP